MSQLEQATLELPPATVSADSTLASGLPEADNAVGAPDGAGYEAARTASPNVADEAAATANDPGAASAPKTRRAKAPGTTTTRRVASKAQPKPQNPEEGQLQAEAQPQLQEVLQPEPKAELAQPAQPQSKPKTEAAVKPAQKATQQTQPQTEPPAPTQASPPTSAPAPAPAPMPMSAVDAAVADLPAVRTRAVRADRMGRIDRSGSPENGGSNNNGGNNGSANNNGGGGGSHNFAPQEPRMRPDRMDRQDRDRNNNNGNERFERGMPRQTQGGGYANNNFGNNNGNGGNNADYSNGNVGGNSGNGNNSNNMPQFATGILEILNEGWGFLRHGNFDQNGQDVYVAQAQIKRFSLRTGDIVYGQVRPPKDSEKYFGLLRVDKVNGFDPDVARYRANFDELVPIYPDDRLILEVDPKNIPAPLATTRENPDPQGLTARFIDLIAPVGKGQRAIIVAPPKAGKTTILKTVALSISVNHPDIHLIAVLIDERPEEVTDIRRFVERAYAGREEQGKPVGEVISSTFDEQPENHMRVADMVLERAKRLVELGKDVVVLLDSLTRLSRASNLTVTPSGRTLQGGLDPAAIYRPKRFFGAARNIENGGSLTIIASSLVETGSRMDDIIFEEFKGTGNMELKLDRGLAERRTFPAIDIKASGTRKDDLLYEAETLKSVWLLHRALAGLQTSEATDFLVERLGKTKTNKEFLHVAGKTS